MKKRLAVVSGGNGHIGSAIAQALGDVGWQVIALTRTSSAERDTIPCDVTNAKAVESAVNAIVRKYGSIDACIHAAAVPIQNKSLIEISPSSFDTSLETAARGAFLLARAVVPHMPKGAAFIGITSKLSEPGVNLMPMGAYLPAKYALRGFLRALAADTRPLGIRVYAVSPGFVAGGLNREVPEPVLELLAKKSAAGKTSASEIARTVTTVCTDANAYPPGSSISIPGEVVPL